MGQARRREFAAALEAFSAEAAGVCELVIITADQGVEMGLAAAAGDRRALIYVRAVVDCLRAIPARRPLCLTCETQFSGATPPPLAFVLLSPARDDIPVTAIAAAVCGDCARRPGLDDRAIAYFRANLFNGMRVLPATAPGSPARN